MLVPFLSLHPIFLIGIDGFCFSEQYFHRGNPDAPHRLSNFHSTCMFQTIGVNQYNFNAMGLRLGKYGIIVDRDDWCEPYSPCIWRGVTCVEGVVEIVQWGRTVSLGEIDLGWLPPSVQVIEISDQRKAFLVSFETRTLPRKLQGISLRECRWKGELDMTTLPDNLETLISVGNAFSGTLALYRLPHALSTVRVLQRSTNTISTVYVDNHALPHSLHEFIVDTGFNTKVRIRDKKETLDSRIVIKKDV